MDATASLFRAIKDGSERDCRRLIEEEGADVHKKDSDVLSLTIGNKFYGYVMGASTIIVAADLGHVDIVELLLSKGANIHDRSNSGLSALMKASIYGHAKAIDVLLHHGSDIHEKNAMNFNCSSILYACLHSQMQVIQLLMSRGNSFDSIPYVYVYVYLYAYLYVNLNAYICFIACLL